MGETSAGATLGDAAMRRPLGDFLRALRAAEVRVSPAEAMDAHAAAAVVDWANRALLRDALCVTLAKGAAEVERFEACFDTFFARAEFTRPASERSDPAEGSADTPEILAERLLNGDAAGLAQAMEAAGAEVGAGDIRLNTQRSLITRRLLDRMGLRGLEGRIAALSAAGEDAAADRLAEGRRALFREAGAFVERQAALHAASAAQRLRDGLLADRKLTAVAPEDFRAMEALVRRMARRLASKYARKRRKAKKGRLDVHRTMAASMAHDGVPFEVIWKARTIHKPKIAVLCDVSRSVAAAAQFLLLFLYSLAEVVERLDAFAFSDRAVSIDDLLKDETVDHAIGLILGRIGLRPTDYGRALADFWALEGDRLDRRTTVIVLGDGRSNFADPRLDLMRRIAEWCRAVVWLNPEPAAYWGQGDSRMDAYARFCTVSRTCNTLAQLERIIEEVLSRYLPK